MCEEREDSLSAKLRCLLSAARFDGVVAGARYWVTCQCSASGLAHVTTKGGVGRRVSNRWQEL